MAIQNEELKGLIDRFWEGNTTLEEEERLRSLSRSPDFPVEFEGIAAYFDALEPKAPQLEGDFETELMEKIPTGIVHRIKPFRTYIAAAAVAIAIMAGWWLTGGLQTEDPFANEQYTQEEVQQAWKETQKALRKVGSELHEVQERSTAIHKFNEAQLSITRK